MREKLIKLVGQIQDCGCDLTDVVHMNFVENEYLVSYLIANGVTFATDNNVGSRWIPVTERLPEDDLPKGSKAKQLKVFVAYRTNGRWVVRTQIRVKGHWYSKPDEWSWIKTSDPITHWMPLPEEPKEVE